MEQQSQQPQAYYVPEQGRYPLFASIGVALMVLGLGATLNNLKSGAGVAPWPLVSFAGLAILAVVLFLWFATTIRENLQGLGNARLKHSYVLGMQWFIFSEVMFFFAFFGTLFYVRVLAVPWLGGQGVGVENPLLWGDFQSQWPLLETPQEAVRRAGGEQVPAVTSDFSGAHRHMSFPGWSKLLHWLPLWNTVVLLSSSVTVYIAHLALKNNQRRKLTLWLGITVALGILFLFLQAAEYLEAYRHYGLTLKAGIYGSTFFMLTGFHGFHVFLGGLILLVMWLRATLRGHFTPENHFGFEAASWYWHFVDVVWVSLFLFVYIL